MQSERVMDTTANILPEFRGLAHVLEDPSNPIFGLLFSAVLWLTAAHYNQLTTAIFFKKKMISLALEISQQQRQNGNDSQEISRTICHLILLSSGTELIELDEIFPEQRIGISIYKKIDHKGDEIYHYLDIKNFSIIHTSFQFPLKIDIDPIDTKNGNYIPS